MLDNLNKTYLLFGIFAGILVFASTVGFILKQKAGLKLHQLLII
jgi:phosphatidate cytidylyltransferase